MTKTLTTATKTYIINRVAEKFRLLGSSFKIIPTFNPRLTRAMGKAGGHFSGNDILFGQIQFASKIVPLLSQAQLDNTIDHEVAHIVSWERYGRKDGGGHGARWKLVMRELGYSNPTATERGDIPGAEKLVRKRVRHVAICQIDGREILLTKNQAILVESYRSLR